MNCLAPILPDDHVTLWDLNSCYLEMLLCRSVRTGP